MLSRSIQRAVYGSRWHIPRVANLSTVSHTIETDNLPPPPHPRKHIPDRQRRSEPSAQSEPPPLLSTPPSPSGTETLPPPNAQSSPLALSDSVRDLLPLLKAQAPHYITVHIHGKPYLLTQGDTLRLPYLQHGVEPGDVLRLNRAINIGSRDYTLKAAAAPPNPKLIYNMNQGKHSYLDERIYVCRAVVMGVESEPLRIKEKTKRRQRKVKTVKSKHRFTVLRVKEVSVVA
ncbi:uncharacterized protein LTR77_001572 [Saxophila tyrrhenica]|uniref:Large ribosomal subunit protein bL21m n=1 Tax=Saxophila tyrrhenica TaxID=1690608 RepID=A0AAV9PQ98_9PEZI|nr:hypothetical protein LTR77_001572 [Saxophila tyrrhenica]